MENSMRIITAAFALSLLLALGSCDRAKETVNDAKKTVDDAGTGITDTLVKSRKFGAAASLKAFEVSIAAFKAANGKYPADLKELSEFSGVEASGDIYEYDPETGKLTAKEAAK
jgi:hypothetical protein